MADRSKIEWTDATWNVARGCTKISPGCKNCYAESFAERWRGIEGHPFSKGFDLVLVPQSLLKPTSWVKPRRIFVGSVTDMFHEDIPADYIRIVFRVAKTIRWHQYQFLTKRPERFTRLVTRFSDDFLPHNAWCGVTVENKKHGVPRIKILRSIPSAVRFLSIEPLLDDLGDIDLTGISWVLIGGETGPGARTMERIWVDRIFAQCREQGVAVFFKQWTSKNRSRSNNTIDGMVIRELPAYKFGKVPAKHVRDTLRSALENELRSQAFM